MSGQGLPLGDHGDAKDERIALMQRYVNASLSGHLNESSEQLFLSDLDEARAELELHKKAYANAVAQRAHMSAEAERLKERDPCCLVHTDAVFRKECPGCLRAEVEVLVGKYEGACVNYNDAQAEMVTLRSELAVAVGLLRLLKSNRGHLSQVEIWAEVVAFIAKHDKGEPHVHDWFTNRGGWGSCHGCDMQRRATENGAHEYRDGHGLEWRTEE